MKQTFDEASELYRRIWSDVNGNQIGAQNGTAHRYILIAGGFVRDTLTRKPVKDLDIFYDGRQMNIERLISRMTNVFDMRTFVSKAGAYVGSFNVFEVKLRDDVYPTLPRVVQFIAINTRPDMYVQTHFDFDLCQVWLGLNGVEGNNEAFTNALKAKTFTLVNNRNPRYLQHYARLLGKYEGWGLVV